MKASVEVFGPIIFILNLGSTMADAKVPEALWLVEASERMASLYVKHGLKVMGAFMRELAPRLYQRYAPNFMKREKKLGPSLVGKSRVELTHLAIVFDEILRRAQKIPGLGKRLQIKAC